MKSKSSHVLPLSYYWNEDVVFLSRDLLGKYLFTNIGGKLTGGMITETEAYRGPDDRASHAFGNRRTKRTEVMYAKGGVCYIYLCYGIHSLFNVITHTEGVPHAILIRSIQPTEGIETMLKRRKKIKIDKTLTVGPGSVSQALGLTTKLNGTSLDSPIVWIEDRGVKISDSKVEIGPRVGIDYAGEHAHLPWRFRVIGEI